MHFRKTPILYLVYFAFVLFSCHKGKGDDRIKVGFSQALSNHEWRRTMNNAMRLQVSLYPNVDLKIYDANYSVELQIKQMEQLIADSSDIIIVSPVKPKSITQVIIKAINAGIPVLVVDRKTENNVHTAYLGADNIEVGRNAAGVIVSSNPTDSIRIIELRGTAGTSPTEERSLGFRQVIDQFARAKILGVIQGDREAESIREKFRDYLKTNSKIDYVFAHNDRFARAAWEVAKDLGLEHKIKFIGVDGLNGPDGGIQMVKDGILEATILYPSGGDEAIKLAMKIMDRKTVPTNNTLSSTVIDKYNADIMSNQFDKINELQTQIEHQISAIKNQEDKYYAQNNLLKVTMALMSIIFSLSLYSIYSIFTIRKKNKQLLLTNNKITHQRNQIEKIAKEVKESNEAKMNFFTGLSHEFKTPLTLILSSVESMSEEFTGKSGKFLNELGLISNNSKRLLRLINQLLDFKKADEGQFVVSASNTNLYNFSKKVLSDFKREAEKRNIQLILSADNKETEIYFDRDLIDKVYFNLLSNAFKFTPDNGRIEILINENPGKDFVSILFKDSGIGIPEKELGKVFLPFYQGSNNRKNSSGIGLHLCKEFIGLHKGNLKVNSLQGTEFIVELLKGSSHFKQEEISVGADLADNNILGFDDGFPDSHIDLESIDNTGSEKYSILIIEDNRDLSQFLKNKLKPAYKVSLSDGSDAIDLAFEMIPDVILCDINLPGKSGFEICEVLKKDLRTSHVPTIILTALDNKESYLLGLQSGADLYLTKPFSFSVLLQSIRSLLYNREKLRYYYTNNIYKIDHTGSFGILEQEFVNKLNILIKENIDNTSFSVEHLAEALNISRVQLYRKVKAMFDISVSDYISNYRLEKARQMLADTSLSISEIAYNHGFSSPNYFSTAFKGKYGVSPASYRSSN